MITGRLEPRADSTNGACQRHAASAASALGVGPARIHFGRAGGWNSPPKGDAQPIA